MIARWLASGPQVLLLNDPTRGIDIGAKRDLYALLGALAGEGLAVVMLSTELDEHVELMDRVLVFREHELFREIDRGEVSREALVAAFFGEERRGLTMDAVAARRRAERLAAARRRGSRDVARRDYSFALRRCCSRSAC